MSILREDNNRRPTQGLHLCPLFRYGQGKETYSYFMCEKTNMKQYIPRSRIEKRITWLQENIETNYWEFNKDSIIHQLKILLDDKLWK